MQQDNHIVRRVGLGQGWEKTPESAPETKAVKVRSGTHIVTGQMIGDTTQPRAFVWIDEAANDPKREIVICPDLHGSWLWEDGKETSLEVAFPGNKQVQRLARKFAYWLKFSKSTGIRASPSVSSGAGSTMKGWPWPGNSRRC